MNARCYPVPKLAQGALLGSAATLDQMDLAARLGSPWAGRVIAKENGHTLHDLLGGDPRLPHGVMADDDDDVIVAGLARGGQVWTPDGWVDHDVIDELMPLTADEVAFVARGFIEGCSHIVLRGYLPVAMIGTGVLLGAVDLPPGTKVLAVVDELDRNAVLDLVAVLPGPKVMRRHDGTWQDDPEWMRVLRSVRPPPVVVLDEAQVAAVLPQVDEHTKGVPFTKEPPKKATSVQASALDRRANDMALDTLLLAAANPARTAVSKASPTGATPPALVKYWVYGRGAAKIRWGTPGAWRRCYRNLSKYSGPFRAKGQCTNLAKYRGGHGVATHVGD